MTDETAIAFELPHVRAAATSGPLPLDRISVRDYVQEVEIGAFHSERGVNQRIRFNVVLEVAAHVAAQDDDVDKVISYDTITDAIAAELSAERIKLLETLAERVAERVLADRRAIRIFVRIEKLDRIPGALGVEIVRVRPDAQTPQIGRAPATTSPDADLQPRIVVLEAAALQDPTQAIAAARAPGAPTILCVPPIGDMPDGLDEIAHRNIVLLQMEQAAWLLASGQDGVTVFDSFTELDWALKQGLLCIWAPSRLVLDAGDPPSDLSTSALARWLAATIGASEF
ncbi:dihydroneopterin aldolase [Pontivivens insulae]|uniref:dihydroneopterin aldolase n=1 Tax=Pontivivens insulae TaxID=1639689 RepID=A0A2R8AD94_9RHOB|nr:dihydroneopterin aldolase [Pontivivens insulae]RED13954.1 dihydroneopterin aldolase [Pontivivens insulae]SPF30028.1 Dihydroneopterin aldolase [Pontivivens insulae]